MHTEVSYEAHPLEYIVLGIEGLELTIPGSDEERYCMYSFPEHNSVLTCMQQVLQEMQERRPEYQVLCLAYIDIIMVQLMRNASVSVTPTHSRFPANRQCAAARHYIDQHYKENITLDLLAEKVSINKYYMAHAFKREYGVSPINYLIGCRIREGKRLLAETDHSLSQIAAVLGFSSPSYFSQSFRSAEGIGPGRLHPVPNYQPGRTAAESRHHLHQSGNPGLHRLCQCGFDRQYGRVSGIHPR